VIPRRSHPSKLPDVGTTIFTVMSRLAAEHDAINLSQGFPDFSPPPRLVELVAGHMRAGLNQYAPMPGLTALRDAGYRAPMTELARGVAHYVEWLMAGDGASPVS
jgi:aspartate/methionine/tyrosine aminotransferase